LAPLTRCLRVRLDDSLSPNRTAEHPNRTDEGLMRTPNRNSSSLEVFRSRLGTMLCVGSTSVWSSMRGKISKYGPLTGLSSPGVGMLRSFEPHHPPKRPEASLRKAAPAQLYQGLEPVSRLCRNPTSTSVRKQGRRWKHRIAVLGVVSDGVSNNTPRQERCSGRGLRSPASSPSKLVSLRSCRCRARKLMCKSDRLGLELACKR
jgi:hypothetical protein